MKILVALEPNPSSSSPVFEVALRQIQNKKVDSLYLLSVTETASVNPIIPLGSIFSTGRSSTQPDSNRREGEEDPLKYDPKGEFVNALTYFANRCQDLGIEHHAILGVAEHVGTLICQAVVEKGIDLVVLGRRKFGTFERLFAGSTSKYCIENSICNVLVVKDQAPSEVHGDVRQVIAASERERERQIKQDEVIEVHSDLDKVRQVEEEERQRRIKEMGGTPEDQAKKEKFDHDLARNITLMAEEEERQRRIKEEEALDTREKLEREAAVHAVVKAEEKERVRRIEEEKELDKREELQRMINQKTADRLEEQERERRLTEEVPSFIDRRLQVELLGKRSHA